METKHTPGPWKFEKTEGYSCGCIESSRGYNIVGPMYTVFHLPTAGRCEPEALADARLIAAAPDLLKACKSALSLCWGTDHLATASEEIYLLRKKLEAAISKATGQQE